MQGQEGQIREIHRCGSHVFYLAPCLALQSMRLPLRPKRASRDLPRVQGHKRQIREIPVGAALEPPSPIVLSVVGAQGLAPLRFPESKECPYSVGAGLKPVLVHLIQ